MSPVLTQEDCYANCFFTICDLIFLRLSGQGQGLEDRQVNERISPTVRWRKVARALRRWRHDTGQRLEDIRTPLGWATSKLSRSAPSRRSARPTCLRWRASTASASRSAIATWRSRCSTGRRAGGRRSKAGDAIPAEFVGLESEANRVRSYEDMTASRWQSRRVRWGCATRRTVPVPRWCSPRPGGGLSWVTCSAASSTSTD